MTQEKYSVLMSVYSKEQPEYLRESIISMLEQTIKPDEIIIVKDGSLPYNLEEVLVYFKKKNLIKIIGIEKNVGLGKALDRGLKYCRNELIVRMDTDDISTKKRCERQLEVFSEYPEISVVGSAVEEFIDDRENVVAYKIAIEKHENIKKQMKFRNPMAHPTVMFRKSHVISSGSYQHYFLNEDYFLWVRMIQKGYKFTNINEPLVKMRINDDTYLRRGGWKYFITQKKLLNYMLNSEFINHYEYFYNNFVRFVMRLLIPNKVRKFVYLRFLRKPVKQ